MWKILRRRADPVGMDLFSLLDPDCSWDSVFQVMQADKIWERAPGTKLRGFQELKARGIALPADTIQELFKMIERVEVDVGGVVDFFNHIYQECRNYELMQVQPEDPFVVRLKSSIRGYISLQNLLTTPDTETLLNIIMLNAKEKENTANYILRERFKEICGSWWKKVERFNAELQDISGNKQVDIFTLIDPVDIKLTSEFYLQPMKSVRKGAGTFFTMQELVQPIVERVISPLCFSASDSKDPKIFPPEVITELKIVDPAMGIGNFLLLAIEFLSLKFSESLKAYDRILLKPSGEIATLINASTHEYWKFKDQQDYDIRINDEITKHIIINCIFGIDIDPICVEIAQFLVCIRSFSAKGDGIPNISNLKVGNSLIGGWKRDLENYPNKAFARKSIDSVPTNQIKIKLKNSLMDQQLYIIDGISNIEQKLNIWCAVWFWNPADMDHCPCLSPSFLGENEKSETVNKLARELFFFHWELEFPEIFHRSNPGFDAVLGNPPWEIVKPNSKEFFGKLDPLYPSMSKQAGLKRQKILFQGNAPLKDEWMEYSRFFSDFSNWVKYRAYCGKKTGEVPFYPFQHQGRADLNLFKLFSELSLAILRRNGRLGLVLPSGFYSDKGTQDLRTFFFNYTKIEWLYSFENTKNIFPIHRNFKFFVLITEKSDKTEKFHAKFMENDIADWKSVTPHTIDLSITQIHGLSPLHMIVPEIIDGMELEILEKIYGRGVILGQQSARNWAVKYATEFHMTNNSDLFHPASNWNVHYAREFDMTQDSQVFTPRKKGLEAGYTKDEFEIWHCPGKSTLLPLYEGKLIDQFDFAQKAYAGGRGLRSKWVPVPYSKKVIEPQYLIQKEIYDSWPRAMKSYKIGFQSIARGVDPRTMVAAFLDALPCLNGVPVLQVGDGNLQQTLVFTSILNSYVYDFALKVKCVGINLNYFLLEETPVIKQEEISPETWNFLTLAVARLNLIHPRFAPAWMSLKTAFSILGEKEWKEWWAVSDLQRISLTCKINAVISYLFGLSMQDVKYILRDDPHNPKGFWRVDKNLDKELRHPVLCVHAFSRLENVGIADFINEEWEVPEPARSFYGSRTVDRHERDAGTWDDCAKLRDKILHDKVI